MSGTGLLANLGRWWHKKSSPSPARDKTQLRNCESITATIAPILKWESVDIAEFSEVFLSGEDLMQLTDRTNGNADAFSLRRCGERYEVVINDPLSQSSDVASRHQRMNRMLSRLHLLRVPSR